MVNAIGFWFDLIRFRKDLCVCGSGINIGRKANVDVASSKLTELRHSGILRTWRNFRHEHFLNENVLAECEGKPSTSPYFINQKKPCTKQAWYWLAEGKQNLLANNKPAWYKVSTLEE